jgi:hypothetical protein
MRAVRRLALTVALLAVCGCTPSSNWYLMDEGYSFDALNVHEFAMEVHLNQLKQLGGDIMSPRFRNFVAERLQRHEMCPSGWVFMPCMEDGSCIRRTSRSVTVAGRCAGL